MPAPPLPAPGLCPGEAATGPRGLFPAPRAHPRRRPRGPGPPGCGPAAPRLLSSAHWFLTDSGAGRHAALERGSAARTSLRPSGAPQRPCQAGGHAPGLGHPSRLQRARPCSEITWGSETEPSHTNNEEEVPGQRSVGRVPLSSVAWEPGAKGGEGAGPGSRHTGGRGAWFPTDGRPTTHLIFRVQARCWGKTQGHCCSSSPARAPEDREGRFLPAVPLLSQCLCLCLLCWFALISPDTGKGTSWLTVQVTNAWPHCSHFPEVLCPPASCTVHLEGQPAGQWTGTRLALPT